MTVTQERVRDLREKQALVVELKPQRERYNDLCGAQLALDEAVDAALPALLDAAEERNALADEVARLREALQAVQDMVLFDPRSPLGNKIAAALERGGQ